MQEFLFGLFWNWQGKIYRNSKSASGDERQKTKKHDGWLYALWTRCVSKITKKPKKAEVTSLGEVCQKTKYKKLVAGRLRSRGERSEAKHRNESATAKSTRRRPAPPNWLLWLPRAACTKNLLRVRCDSAGHAAANPACALGYVTWCQCYEEIEKCMEMQARRKESCGNAKQNTKNPKILEKI